MQVFRELKRRRLIEYKVGVTYVEIYNETFRDLLNPDTKSSDIGVSEKRCDYVTLMTEFWCHSHSLYVTPGIGVWSL